MILESRRRAPGCPFLPEPPFHQNSTILVEAADRTPVDNADLSHWSHQEGAVTRPTQEIGPDRAGVATYRIRVAGALGEEWSRRAQGMSLTVHQSEPKRTFTELLGALPDEAALMGVLDALYNYGARLLSVECVDEDGTSVAKLGDSMEPLEREKGS